MITSLFTTTGAIIMFLALVLLFIVVSGISDSVIYSNYKHITDGSNACPTFPHNITSFSLEKQIFNQQHWRYNIQEFNGYVQLMCPVTQYDAAVYLNDDFAGFIDGKMLSTVSKSYVKDCHGNVLFVTQTADLFHTLINGLDIIVSYLIYNSDESMLLAYVEGEHVFFTDSITFKAASDHHEIATLNRNTLSLSWIWNINILDTTHPAASPLVLSTVAGKRSFSDSYSYSNGNSNQYSDLCNSWFWASAWLDISILGIVFIVFCIVLISAFCNK
jgi:hypothetical protein